MFDAHDLSASVGNLFDAHDLSSSVFGAHDLSVAQLRAEEDNVDTKSQLGSTLCPCTAICVRSRMDNVGTTSRLGFAVAMIMLGSRRPSLGPLSGSLTHATAVRPGAEQRCEALRRTAL